MLSSTSISSDRSALFSGCCPSIFPIADSPLFSTPSGDPGTFDFSGTEIENFSLLIVVASVDSRKAGLVVLVDFPVVVVLLVVVTSLLGVETVACIV